MAREYPCQCGHSQEMHTGVDRKFMGRECTGDAPPFSTFIGKAQPVKCICSAYRTTATALEQSLDRIEEILKSIDSKIAARNERGE